MYDLSLQYDSWESRDAQDKSHHTLWVGEYSKSVHIWFKVKFRIDTTKAIVTANLFPYVKKKYYYIIL